MIKLTGLLFVLMYAEAAMAQNQSQLGSSVIGFGGIDSLSLGLGRAATPLCARPGACLPGDCAVYRFIGSGDWQDASNWALGIKPPTVITGCYTIIVDPLGTTKSVMIKAQTIMAGGTLIVEAGKQFIIPGNLIID